MSNESYLEVTYRRGKVVAGYLHLPRREGDSVVRSRKVGPGIVVDYAQDGRPIGVEITSFSAVSLQQTWDILASLHIETIAKEDLAPLLVG